MMKILVDADMVLEALLNRSRFPAYFEDLWDLVPEQIQGYISEPGLEKIRIFANLNADEVISDIEADLSICSIDSHLLQQARLLDIRDFESAVEVACAITRNIGAIVTQEPQNFVGSDLPVLSVGDLLKRQSLETSLKKNTSPVLLVNDCLESQHLLDIETPLCNSLEVEHTLKYRIRNSIATVLEVFEILQKAGFQGMSRQELGRRANRSNSKINNILWDLQSFNLVVCQGNRISVKRNLLYSEALEIANYLAEFLKQHIVIKEIYEKSKPNQTINRGYLQTLIKEVYPNEKYANPKSGKNHTEEGYYQPLLFEIFPSNKPIATKSVGDYTSRMLGWFFFTGLLEYRGKEVIVIPIGEGKQKGKLMEETEPQQLKLFQYLK
jgi:hypothetical protein